MERREVDGRVPLLRVHRSIRRHGAFHGYRTRGEKGTFPVMTAAIDAIKQTLEKVKGVRGLARKLADDADIIATVGLDSLEMLRFMLDIEERLSIQIDFDRLEYSSFNSIRALAEFMEAMPSKINANPL